jgi:hypothetical protein
VHDQLSPRHPSLEAERRRACTRTGVTTYIEGPTGKGESCLTSHAAVYDYVTLRQSRGQLVDQLQITLKTEAAVRLTLDIEELAQPGRTIDLQKHRASGEVSCRKAGPLPSQDLGEIDALAERCFQLGDQSAHYAPSIIWRR